MQDASAQGSSTSKAYVCLFTCCSTRAVHLELCNDLSVSSFLLLFCRFASRRGLPVTLISDNAKTFKAASRDIVRIARSAEVIKFLNSHRVCWKFIVEKAPWWGGFWERLIRSVKRSLKKSIGKGTLNYEELNTIIVEVEAIINSRPLTVRCKFSTGENIDEFDEFPAIRQYFPYQNFHLVSYSMLMIGIRQFFTRQNFPNPDSSKFSTVKILCHTVLMSWMIRVGSVILFLPHT